MTSGTGQSYYRSYLPNAIHSQWGEGNEYQSFQWDAFTEDNLHLDSDT